MYTLQRGSYAIHRPLLEDDMECDIECDIEGARDCYDNDDLENDGIYFNNDDEVYFTLGFKCRNKVTIGYSFRIRKPFAYFLCK